MKKLTDHLRLALPSPDATQQKIIGHFPPF
jgi:hypothetical protein